eukprot:GHVP01022614.1.p1 GENE.GHVP01022614.1~~GHVP01022614.1.p1  ORF type:complete len:102 (+),score=3.58 GHVP01022614.1:46-351(+)
MRMERFNHQASSMITMLYYGNLLYDLFCRTLGQHSSRETTQISETDFQLFLVLFFRVALDSISPECDLLKTLLGPAWAFILCKILSYFIGSTKLKEFFFIR